MRVILDLHHPALAGIVGGPGTRISIALFLERLGEEIKFLRLECQEQAQRLADMQLLKTNTRNDEDEGESTKVGRQDMGYRVSFMLPEIAVRLRICMFLPFPFP